MYSTKNKGHHLKIRNNEKKMFKKHKSQKKHYNFFLEMSELEIGTKFRLLF